MLLCQDCDKAKYPRKMAVTALQRRDAADAAKNLEHRRAAPPELRSGPRSLLYVVSLGCMGGMLTSEFRGIEGVKIAGGVDAWANCELTYRQNTEQSQFLHYKFGVDRKEMAKGRPYYKVSDKEYQAALRPKAEELLVKIKNKFEIPLHARVPSGAGVPSNSRVSPRYCS